MNTADMTVGELAKRSKVTTETIRHYTDKGLLWPKRNPANGYKIFQEADVVRVRFICQAKQLGFSLSEVGQILFHADQGNSPCSDVRDIVQTRIKENRLRLDELLALQTRMEGALDQWRAMPDQLPDGDSICHLIESVAKSEDKT